jgi:hypothetical protein
MIYTPELSLRIPAALLSIAVGSVAFLILVRKWRPIERYSRRTTVVFLGLTMIASVFFVSFPTASARSYLAYTARDQWYRALEPNFLSRRVLMGYHKHDISIPTMSEGIFLAEEHASDLHIDLDSRGELSMSNVPLSQEQLAVIIACRKARIGTEFRMFLWFDKSSPEEDQNTVIELLASAGSESIYQVVTIVSATRREAEHGVITRNIQSK